MSGSTFTSRRTGSCATRSGRAAGAARSNGIGHGAPFGGAGQHHGHARHRRAIDADHAADDRHGAAGGVGPPLAVVLPAAAVPLVTAVVALVPVAHVPVLAGVVPLPVAGDPG